MKAKISLFIIYCLTVTSLFGQDYEKLADIPYTVKKISNAQKLDLYLPKSDDPTPCMVWIHGGAWMFGSKNRLAPEVDTLLHQGYAIASIEYRLSGESIFPAQIYDCKTAIRFLKENCVQYNIDSSKIAVAGSSAGGHLAALVGTSGNVPELEDKTFGSPNASSKVQAVVDFYGPTNFLIMDNLPNTPPDSCIGPDLHLIPDSPESLLLGCNIEDCHEKVIFANPITYISEDDPPFLIFHGTYDCTVTPLSSIELEKHLKRHNINAELHLIPHAGHGGPQFITTEIKAMIIEFLNKTFK